MKQIFILLFCLTCGCIVPPNPSLYNAHSDQFKNRYKNFFDKKEEVVVASWYNYVKTKTKDNTYILRTFFPETKQITSKVIFKDITTQIPNGPAKYWHENGNLKSEGNFNNGDSIGVWKFYYRKSGKLALKGNYESDKKHGKWEKFDSEGRPEEIVNYDYNKREGEFIQYDSLESIVNEGVYKSDKISQQTAIDTINYSSEKGMLEYMPYLSQCKGIENNELRTLCSNKALLDYIYANLQYPRSAKYLRIEGMTINEFIIEKDGSVKEIEVVVGICQDFKNSNLAILKRMPKWEPGMKRGRNVRVTYTLPINYRLN